MTALDAIESLVASNQKIAAIKELRGLTGLGLKDAKDAVEHFQAHGRWPEELRRGGATASAVGPALDQQTASAHPLAAIEQFVAQGQLINAIKDLRALTSWGLKESKDAVDEYRASGAWTASLLAMLGGTHSSRAPAPHQPPPPTRSNSTTDPDLAPALQALARHLGRAPHVHLAVPARRAGRDGHLVMLRDRSCFVHHDHGLVDPTIDYGMVHHVEVGHGVPAQLFVSFAHLHERFELQPADADAALALFRVFAP